jgi:hypothetical protein
MNGREYEGHADVRYGIEINKETTNPTALLTVDDAVPSIGVQAATSVLDVTSSLGVRSGYAPTAESMLDFDMRSISYVCGALAAMGASGIQPDLPDGNCVATVMDAAHTLSLGSAPTFVPSMWNSTTEFASLMSICTMAGADEVYLATQNIPSKGQLYANKSLGCYAVRIQANILAETNLIAAAADHDEAFFAGAQSVMKVLGQSDDGGNCHLWVPQKTYPKPKGMIRHHLTTVMESSTVLIMDTADLTRYMVAYVLESAGRVARADPMNGEGLPLTYLEEEGEKGPQDLDGFTDDVYAMWKRWKELSAAENGFVMSDTHDTASHRTCFKENKPIRHFKGTNLTPFQWIEPGPVSCTLTSNVFMLGCQGQGVELPLVKDAVGYKTGSYQEFKGRPMPNGVVALKMDKGFKMRENGIAYLYSSTYHEENGLSRFVPDTSVHLGVTRKELANSNNAQDLASQRWLRYDCPIAHPSECVTDKPFLLKYAYGSTGRQAKLEDLTNAKVNSGFGSLIVCKNRGVPNNRTHRDVPDGLKDHLLGTAPKSYPLWDASDFIIMESEVKKFEEPPDLTDVGGEKEEKIDEEEEERDPLELETDEGEKSEPHRAIVVEAPTTRGPTMPAAKAPDPRTADGRSSRA